MTHHEAAVILSQQMENYLDKDSPWKIKSMIGGDRYTAKSLDQQFIYLTTDPNLLDNITDEEFRNIAIGQCASILIGGSIDDENYDHKLVELGEQAINVLNDNTARLESINTDMPSNHYECDKCGFSHPTFDTKKLQYRLHSCGFCYKEGFSDDYIMELKEA